MKSIDVGFRFGKKHYQFVDRVGDTFHRKSENASTNEVAEIINSHPEIIFSNVYGADLPALSKHILSTYPAMRDRCSFASCGNYPLQRHIN
jgi:acyl-CoA synthetase (AMP-forming)/AMP-acid ligase II